MIFLTQFILSILTLLLTKADIHHILCPRGCNCYAENNTNPESSILHFVCRWKHLNSNVLHEVAEYDPIFTIRIQCPHGSTFKADPPDKLFYRLKNLEHITIHRCKIRSLKKGFFKKQSRLNSLKITSAELAHLSNDLFEYIPKTRYLDMSDNNLKIIPFAVSKLLNLEYLILSRNWIQFLSSGLSTLKKLKHLILDGNNFTSIDLEQIPKSIDTLRLRANQLQIMNHNPVEHRSLHFLDLAKNRLEYLASVGTINRLPSSLQVVYLNGNNIETIQNGSFAHMRNLSEVDLRNNAFKDFPRNIFDGVKHKFVVKLAGNPLKCLCSLQWMLDVQTPIIFGDFNKITCTQMFDERKEVTLDSAKRRGDLVCNYEVACPQDCTCCLKPVCSCFSRCPRGCTCWHSATPYFIELGQNIVECDSFRTDRLAEIPAVVTEIRLNNTLSKGWSLSLLGRKYRLKSLNLTNAGVSEVTEDLIKRNFPVLQHLDLSNNLLTTFPAAKLFGIINLQTLFINNNRITNFTMADLKRMEYYKRLKLGGKTNLYHCDCKSPSELQIWLNNQNNKVKVSDYENVYCKLKDDRVVHMIYMDPTHPQTLCQQPTTPSTIVKYSDSLHDEYFSNSKGSNQFGTSRPHSGNKHREQINIYNRQTSSSPKSYGKQSTEEPPFDFERSVLITIALFIAIILLLFLLIAVGIIAYFRYYYLKQRSLKKTPITSSRKTPKKAITRIGTTGTSL